MTTSVTVKTKIRVNGQDYASVDDMPPDVRQAYDRALATIGGDRHAGPLNLRRDAQAVSSARIVLNGQEYGDADQMPAEARRLYDQVMATLQADPQTAPGAPTAGGPQFRQVQWQDDQGTGSRPASAVTAGALRPESTGSRLAIAGAVIGALLFALFVFGR